jgi:cytochrome P450
MVGGAHMDGGSGKDRPAGTGYSDNLISYDGASMVAAPALDANLYAREVLRDSRALFAQIREAGPVVWLPRHRMYAMGRFEDVRAALRNDEVFQSGMGVAANGVANRLGRATTLFSDGATHDVRRRVLMRSLGAKALTGVQGQVDEQAEALIERLVSDEGFEAAREFASHLPLAVVADLVGIRGDRTRMLRWAAATFDGLGPLNRRGLQAGPVSLSLLLYTQALRPGRVAPGSWVASVFEARDRGELTTREAKALVIDFVAPALDTTILAGTHLLWALAQHPEAWAEIRRDPALIPAAVVENVRLASPIRGFTRLVARDHTVGGITLPHGSRVVLLFGAANLDETRFPDPERFDLRRANAVHLGWGNGPHTCVGLHLAKLELQALLRAMVPRVERVHVAEPRRLLNNTLQGIDRLPARFTAVASDH